MHEDVTNLNISDEAYGMIL
uniref:Uncharacterized protein n=1 Tax=Oryza nivara TaxID=4536 RepID=A0A0E0FLB0_ORYNI